MKIINRYVSETTSTYASDDVNNKIDRNGTNNLSDAELLSVFISPRIKGRTQLELAQAVLQKVGSIGALTELDRIEFCKFDGLNKSNFTKFKAAIELDRRRLFVEATKVDAISSPACLYNFLRRHIGSSKTEIFGIVYLNTRMKPIEIVDVQSGTVDMACVIPREIARHCLTNNAKHIFLFHNHPSSSLNPSSADCTLTKKIKNVLEPFDIEVRDHIILTETGHMSFLERGLI